ncbi:MAG: apolipoprotein N-acyltransferase [Verrucomicrobia bacterium]|nr:apolipoprotein N-acyltransferase [Verrucomicrobiota bacterium]
MFWFYLLSSFAMLALGQPARVPELGIFSSAIGLALFWKAMLRFENPRQRFLLAFVWFSSIQMIQLSWMATTHYMGPLIVVVYLFLNLALGVQFGALSLFLKPEERIGTVKALAMAGTWVIFEWTRLFPCTGFTWNPLGLFLSTTVYSLQWASVFGIYGLSFWVVLTNIAALSALTKPHSRNSVVAFGCLAAFPYLFGWAYLPKVAENSGHLNAILVQTGLMPEQKDYYADRSYAFVPAVQQWDRILKVIREQEKGRTQLIVLPEGSFPYGAYRYGYYLEQVQRIWQKHFGSESLKDFPEPESPYAVFEAGRWKVANAYLVQALANHYGSDVVIGLDDDEYNAAFLFHPRGGIPQRYEKRILVPVGEYVPFRNFKLVSQFVSQQFGILFSFSPGKEAKLFQSNVPFSISICYEETYSGLIRESRLKGAELFVNLTNNAWFPSSKLAQQHYDHGMIRAVENGVPVLRACNTGVTGGIDAYGRAIELLPASEQGASALSISIPLKSHKTLYVLWGDLGILTLSGASILSFVAVQIFSKRKKKLL